MPLILYQGKLLHRNGVLAADINCCCDKACPVGDLVFWAFYFTDADQIPVGNTDFIDEAIAQLDGESNGGYDLKIVFSVGNADDESQYYSEFQVWMIASCCPKNSCDTTGYELRVDNYANNTTHIDDASSQFEWEPVWQQGSCVGLEISSNDGVDTMAECVRQVISFPNDPATLTFHLREDLEICCE